MKKMFFLLLINLISIKLFCQNRAVEKNYKIECREVGLLDGVSNCLDGNAIEEIIQVRKLIKDLQNGVIDARKNEHIHFLGKPVSIYYLIEYEQKYLKKGADQDYKTCLKQVKHSFIDTTKKFMKRIEQSKSLVVRIIKLSCDKRNISEKDTIMLEWANTNGNEEAMLNDRIKSFGDFKIFLEQVYNFLGDLTKSCEKGFKQYIAKKQKPR